MIVLAVIFLAAAVLLLDECWRVHVNTRDAAQDREFCEDRWYWHALVGKRRPA